MTSAQEFLTEFTKALISANPLSRQDVVADYVKRLEAREAEIGRKFCDRLEEELDELSDGWIEGTGAVLRGGIEIAAKKAAGIQ